MGLHINCKNDLVILQPNKCMKSTLECRTTFFSFVAGVRYRTWWPNKIRYPATQYICSIVYGVRVRHPLSLDIYFCFRTMRSTEISLRKSWTAPRHSPTKNTYRIQFKKLTNRVVTRGSNFTTAMQLLSYDSLRGNCSPNYQVFWKGWN